MRNVAHDVDMSNAATPADTAFTVGNTYATAALEADAATPHLTPMVGRDDLWPAPVTARTARFVTLSDSDGKTVRVGVRVWNGVESCSPFGTA
mgnify:CR=1 FL=1